MPKPIAQSTSANIIIGPIIDISGDVVTGAAPANNDVVLVKENAASSQRSQTTAVTSVGPGLYRVVLNTADTDTLGGLVLEVSVTGGIMWRSDAEIWNANTHALFFGSADHVAGSAGVSAIVTAVVNQALSDYGVPTSAAMSAMVSAVVDQFVLTSASLSTQVGRTLDDRLLHTLLAASASVTAVHDNSMFALIMATADANDFNRTTDSLAAIADGAGATPLTSSQVSVIVQQALSDRSAADSALIANALVNRSAGDSAVIAQAIADYDPATSAQVSVAVLQALEDQLLHTLLAQSASVTAVNDNSMFARIMATAQVEDFNRATDSLAAISDAPGGGASQQEVSVAVAQALADYDVPTSADISAIVTVVMAQALSDRSAADSALIANALVNRSAGDSAVVAQAISDYDPATSAQVSVAVLQALEDQLLHTLLANSASVTAVHDNSMFARIMASAQVEDFDRTTDSLKGIRDAGAAGGATQTEVSTAISNALDVRLLHILLANSASVTAVHDNSMFARIMATADANDFNRATDSLAAISDGGGGGITSQEVSVVVAQALGDYDVASSSDVSAIVTAVVQGILDGNQIPSSAEVSAIFEGAWANRSAALSSLVGGALVNRSAQDSVVAAQAISDAALLVSANLSQALSAGFASRSAAESALIANALVNRSAQDSVVAAQALSDYDPATSAQVSVAVLQALEDQLLHTLLANSASVTAIHDNSMFARIMTSAQVEDFDRTTDSLKGIKDAGAAGGATQTEVSTAISNALDVRLLHILLANSASVTAVHDNSMFARIMATADANDYDRTTDSLAAIADTAGAGGITSAAASVLISTVVQGIIDGNDIPSSSNISAIVSAVVDNFVITSASLSSQMAQAVSDYGALVSANLSTALSAYAGAGVATSGGAGLTSAQVSTIVAQAITDADLPSSADVSTIVENIAISSASLSSQFGQALDDRLLHTLLVASASVSALHANSIMGRIMTSSDPTTYDRTSDSLAALADGAVAGLNSAQASTIVAQALQDRSAQDSVVAAQAISDAGLLVSANLSNALSVALQTYDVPTSADVSSIVAGAGTALTSGEVSTIVAQALADEDIPTSGAISGIVIQALTDRGVALSGEALTSGEASAIAAQAISDAGLLTSSNLSAGIEAAVFQRTLTESSSVPVWSDVQFDDAVEWMLQRNVARVRQTSTSVGIYSSADNQIASASVNIASGSANQDHWVT